jgi:antitoxin (DNA-binding transcriptional repressor) of toxin-antitoxin stability system
LVERGETIEITDRGRPATVLAPPPQGSPLDQHRAAGEINSAIGDLVPWRGEDR